MKMYHQQTCMEDEKVKGEKEEEEQEYFKQKIMNQYDSIVIQEGRKIIEKGYISG